MESAEPARARLIHARRHCCLWFASPLLFVLSRAVTKEMSLQLHTHYRGHWRSSYTNGMKRKWGWPKGHRECSPASLTGLKSPICWPLSRNDEHAESSLTKYFGTIVGDNHDPFVLTSTMTLHTLLLDPRDFHIFLRKLFIQTVCLDFFFFWRLASLGRLWSIRTCGYRFPTTSWWISRSKWHAMQRTRCWNKNKSWTLFANEVVLECGWSVAGGGINQKSFSGCH